MSDNDNQAAIRILLQALNVNPELWDIRKRTAEILFTSGKYEEASDVLWNAPEIPSTDTDVAFAIKILSRAQPNRAIRMIYEVVRRNHGKPHKNMALARALNNIGMYMEASRFYGAALASDPSLIDLSFELQTLWLDDSGKLIEEWVETTQDVKQPLDVSTQEISGGTIAPSEIPNNIQGLEDVAASHFPPPPPMPQQQIFASQVPQQAANPQMPATPNPAMPSQIAPNFSAPSPVQPSGHTAFPSPQLATPPVMPATSSMGTIARATSPLLDANAGFAPSAMAAQTPFAVPAPAPAPVIPTQPLQGVAAKPVSIPTSFIQPTSQPLPPEGQNATGKLLTPAFSHKPNLRMK